MNLQTDYVEEHAANAGTIDLLEVETSERIRLEKELSELRVIHLFYYSFIHKHKLESKRENKNMEIFNKHSFEFKFNSTTS